MEGERHKGLAREMRGEVITCLEHRYMFFRTKLLIETASSSKTWEQLLPVKLPAKIMSLKFSCSLLTSTIFCLLNFQEPSMY